jgi:FG-GAP-like repeat
VLSNLEAGPTPLVTTTIANAKPIPDMQFVSLGDDPLVVASWDPRDLWISARDGDQLKVLAHADESAWRGDALDPGLAPTLFNRDLDGDGKNELLAIFYSRTPTPAPFCSIWVARSVGGKVTMGHYSADIMCAGGAAALVDAPPLDGRLDVLFFDGAGQLRLARQQEDGTFLFPQAASTGGVAEPAPQLFDDGSRVRAWDPSWSWIDTVDMNGDGIPDVVLAAPEGVYVALAQVKRP